MGFQETFPQHKQGMKPLLRIQKQFWSCLVKTKQLVPSNWLTHFPHISHNWLLVSADICHPLSVIRISG